MKISLTQYDTTVTIEEKRNGHTTDDMAQIFRQLLAGQGYTEEQIKQSIPNEHDVMESIQEALELQRGENFLDTENPVVDTIP